MCVCVCVCGFSLCKCLLDLYMVGSLVERIDCGVFVVLLLCGLGSNEKDDGDAQNGTERQERERIFVVVLVLATVKVDLPYIGTH